MLLYPKLSEEGVDNSCQVGHLGKKNEPFSLKIHFGRQTVSKIQEILKRKVYLETIAEFFRF
jgi:hypothetical protein